MTPSGTNNGGGCFSGVGRLLLCRRSLQTHPSDEIPPKSVPTVDLCPIQGSNISPLTANSMVEAPVANSTTTPGVVARLMGLDWLPNPGCGRSAPDSLVSRSKSVNFVDYLVESHLDLKQQHRRVTSSVSFCADQLDLQMFVEKSNNGYRMNKLEANVENVRQRNELEQRKKNGGYDERKNNVGFAKPKKKRMDSKDADRRKLNDTRICSCKKDRMPVKAMNRKEVVVESKVMNKIKKNQYANSDSTHEMPSPEKKRSAYTTNCKEKNSEKKKRVNRKAYIEEVKKMTEEEMKELNWVVQFQSIEEISLLFGKQIMDLLLEQLVLGLLQH